MNIYIVMDFVKYYLMVSAKPLIASNVNQIIIDI